jgi:hypothetical protein
MPYGQYYAITKLWARASDDVWALSDFVVPSRVALHFDGQRWTTLTLPAAGGMFGLPGGPTWLYGEGGVILRHR